MKAVCLNLLIALCLLLSGCDSRAQEDYLRFSSELAEKESLSFISKLSCRYEDRSMDFTLGFTGDENGCRIEVLEPEEIKGVAAELSPGSASLRYEDAVLAVGELDGFGLSPMTALPLFVRALRDGQPKAFYSQEGCPVAELILNDELSVSLRFKAGTMQPLSAEIISGGQVRVFLQIGNWH